MTFKIRQPVEIIRQGGAQIEQVLGTTIRREISVQIGDPTSGAIYANDEKTEIYTHGYGSDPAGTTTISASGIPKAKIIYGQPVLIKQTPSGRYRFVGIDEQADEIFSAGLTEEATQEPVYLNQIRYGTIHPYSGLQVLVVAAIYGDDYVGDLLCDPFDGTATDTSAASISVPTTNNQQIGVLIQIDASTGTLEYKQSAEYSASVSRTRAYANGNLPLPDANRNRAGYVFLKAGMSDITYGDIWELPEFLSNAANASDYFPIVIDSAIEIASNRQIVVSDFSITSGSLTIDGRVKIV